MAGFGGWGGYGPQQQGGFGGGQGNSDEELIPASQQYNGQINAYLPSPYAQPQGPPSPTQATNNAWDNFANLVNGTDWTQVDPQARQALGDTLNPMAMSQRMLTGSATPADQQQGLANMQQMYNQYLQQQQTPGPQQGPYPSSTPLLDQYAAQNGVLGALSNIYAALPDALPNSLVQASSVPMGSFNPPVPGGYSAAYPAYNPPAGNYPYYPNNYYDPTNPSATGASPSQTMQQQFGGVAQQGIDALMNATQPLTNALDYATSPTASYMTGGGQ